MVDIDLSIYDNILTFYYAEINHEQNFPKPYNFQQEVTDGAPLHVLDLGWVMFVIFLCIGKCYKKYFIVILTSGQVRRTWRQLRRVTSQTRGTLWTEETTGGPTPERDNWQLVLRMQTTKRDFRYGDLIRRTSLVTSNTQCNFVKLTSVESPVDRNI